MNPQLPYHRPGVGPQVAAWCCMAPECGAVPLLSGLLAIPSSASGLPAAASAVPGRLCMYLDRFAGAASLSSWEEEGTLPERESWTACPGLLGLACCGCAAPGLCRAAVRAAAYCSRATVQLWGADGLLRADCPMSVSHAGCPLMLAGAGWGSRVGRGS